MMKRIGCFWCRFRKGLKCTNKVKLKRNGVGWLVTGVADSLEDLKKYKETFGYLCSEFEPEPKVRVIFT